MKVSGFRKLVIGHCSLVIASTALAGSFVPQSSLPTNRAAARAVVFSSSHRFAVSGCPAVQGVQIAQWAEDVEERLARFIGMPIPPGDPMPITIRLGDDPASPRGKVIRSQGYDAGLLDQKLDMINLRLADQEDLLEGLCSLLLNRAVVARQPGNSRTPEPPRVPDWLAVGIAQNLFTEARQRNMRTVMTAWKNGKTHKLDEILAWEFMPDGRWDDKAEAGLFVEFILPSSLAAKRISALLARVESGEAINADFIVQHLLFMKTVADAEKARDVWLASQQDVQTELGGISPERIASLVRMLEIRPSDYGFSESEKIPLLCDLKDIIRHRDEKWSRQLAERMSMKMKLLAVGQAPDFQRVIAGYIGFLDAAAGSKAGFTGGLFGGKGSASALQKLLDQAEQQFVAFQAAQKKQGEFMENSATKKGAPPPDDAISSYLDKVENRSSP